MQFDELMKKLGYENVNLEVIKKLSHLLKDDRSNFILSFMSNDRDSLDKYAEKIDDMINKIDCDVSESELEGHEGLLVYYICEKLRRKYNDLKQKKYEVVREILDSLPLLIYLHDLFKGLKLGSGKNRKIESGLQGLLKDIFEEYDKISSIAEESPELIGYKENDKENYPVAIVSPIFGEIKEIYPSGDTKDFDDYILNKLNVTGSPKELIDKEKWDVIAKSLLLKPQRTWFSGNDIAIIAHLRGAFYAYLLSNGATLIKLENPFFNPTSLKDLLGSSSILRIFSYHLNMKILKKMKVSLLFLPIVGEKEISIHEFKEIFNSPFIELLTPFTVYTTIDSMMLLIPYSIKGEFEEIVEEAFNETLSEIFKEYGIDKKDENKEHIEIHYDIIKSGLLAGSDEREKAKLFNEFLLAESPITKSAYVVHYSTYLPLSDDVCDKCKVRMAIEEDELEKLEKIVKFRNEVLGRKERLCHVCTAVRLSSVFFREYAASLDEVGRDLIFIAVKIEPYVPEGKVDFNKIVDEKLEMKIDELKQKIELIRREMKDEVISRLKKENDAINKMLSKNNVKKEELIKAMEEEYKGERISEFLGQFKTENKSDYLITFCALAFEKIKDIGILNNIFKELKIEEKDEHQLAKLIDNIQKIKEKSSTGNLPYNLTVQDSIDRRLSQLIEFFLLMEELKEKLPEAVVLVPPSSFNSFVIFVMNIENFRKNTEKIINVLNTLSKKPHLHYYKPIIRVFIIRSLSDVPMKNIIELISSLDEKVSKQNAVVYLPVYLGRGVMEVGEPTILDKLEFPNPEELEEFLNAVVKLSEENKLLNDRFLEDIRKYPQEKLSVARLLK
ncbi:MAG: hypothetical protein RQ872_08030 [Sulfolobaceae archaeon]|nr:hypothetical protein [Sulfolobaceae archaeon]